MICKKCGKENVENANFCAECGSQLIKQEENKKGKFLKKIFKEKVNVKELQFSAKLGYYSRIITFTFASLVGLLALIVFLMIIFSTFNPLGPSDSDSKGFAFLALLILVPIVFGVTAVYISIINVLGVVLPSIWIDKKEKVSIGIEILRIFDLIVCFLLMIVPITIFIMKGTQGLLDLIFKIA